MPDKGEQIALAARVARVATEAVCLAAVADADTAVRALPRLAGRRLDPDETAVFIDDAVALFADAAAGDPSARVGGDRRVGTVVGKGDGDAVAVSDGGAIVAD